MKIFTLLLFTTLLFSSQSLTLNQAIDILKNDNLEIKSADLEVKSAKEDVQIQIIQTGKHFLKGRQLSKCSAVRPTDVPPPLKQGEVSGVFQRVYSVSMLG